METAIAFLTNDKKKIDKELIKQLVNIYDVYVIIDNDISSISYENQICYISIRDLTCIESGYHSSNVQGTHIKKNPIALDKALFTFIKIKNKYKFVLLIEDDVFIPSIETIKFLINQNDDYDLVIPFDIHKKDSIWDWHWKSVIPLIQPPYYFSMACVVGVSRKMLNVISKYVKENNTLIYLEVMFNTLAHKNKLKISNPKQLSSVIFNGYWGLNDFIRRKNNLFHPVKDYAEYSNYRKLISYYNNTTYCIPCTKEYLFPIKYQNTINRI